MQKEMLDCLKEKELKLFLKAVNENDIPEIGHWQNVAKSRYKKRLEVSQ